MANTSEPVIVHNSNAVTLKLPEFWTENPAIWFVQAEAQFALRGITNDDTKYHHVVSALPDRAAARIADLFADPLSEGTRYNFLKDRLLRTFQGSLLERVNKLLDFPPLGDRLPSALLAAMAPLAPGGKAEGAYFVAIFLRKLPDYIRRQVVNETLDTAADLRRMAAKADKLVTVCGPSMAAAVQSAGSPSETPPNCDEHQQHQTTEDGPHTIEAVHRQQPHRQPNRRSSDRPPTCWKHKRFGTQARGCADPATCPMAAPQASENGRRGRRY